MTAVFDPDAVPAWLGRRFSTRFNCKSVIAGVNDDDCAVMPLSDRFLVATTDFVNSWPIALQLKVGNLRTVGRLAVAASLSDLCGTGAIPRALLCAVKLPRKCSVADFRAIIRGVRDEAKRWSVPVVGGDTKLGDSLSVLTVGLGSVRSRKELFLKFRAKRGDLVWASGELGSCNAAVLGLTRGLFRGKTRLWAIRAITVPTIPLQRSRALAESTFGHAGTDVSDGLSKAIHQICDASAVGIEIDAQRIPISQPAQNLAESLGIPAWALAFGAGGDFQFIVTTPSRYDRTIARMGFHLIGKVTGFGRRSLHFDDGSIKDIPTDAHDDAKNLTFADEIQQMVGKVANVQL
jgi:thiamine-monophosphate kinase